MFSYPVFFSLFLAPLDVVVHFLVFLRSFRLRSFLSQFSPFVAHIKNFCSNPGFFLLTLFAKDLTGTGKAHRTLGVGFRAARQPAAIRPIAQRRRFRIRRQAWTPGDSADRAPNTLYQRLYSHTSHTRTQQFIAQFSARCSIYGKTSTCEDKSSIWLHPATPPIKTIIWFCFAAGVDAAVLESGEKANKRRSTVLR